MRVLVKLKLLAIIVSVSVHANELHQAVSEYNMFAIERILNQKGFEDIINQHDDDGKTPLSIAVENDDIEIVQMLVNAGADINVQNNNGDTPLNIAAAKQDRELVAMLLRYTFDTTANMHRDKTLLQFIFEAYGISCRIDQLILRNSAHVDSQTIDRGSNPLYITPEEGKMHTIKSLLEKADVHYSMNHDMAVHITGEKEYKKFVQLLLDAAEKETELYEKEDDTEIIQLPIDVNSRDYCGATPLHIATHGGDIARVTLLLGHGADVDCLMNNGDTALHIAVESNNIEIVKLLLDAGADVNSLAVVDPDEDTQSGGLEAVTPLMGAVACGNIDLVKLLLEHGANPTIGTNGWNIFRMISFAFERQNDPLSPEKRATCKAILCLCVEWVRNNFKHDPEIRKIIGDVVERYDLFPALLSVVVLSSVPGKLSNE